MLSNIQDLIKAGTYPRNYLSDDPKKTSRAVSVWRDEELEPFMTWTDKASYLAWVVQWKVTYQALTEQARGAEPTLHREWEGISYVNGKSVVSVKEYAIHGHNLRWLAHLLLALRAYGKRRSWTMKQQAKQAA